MEHNEKITNCTVSIKLINICIFSLQLHNNAIVGGPKVEGCTLYTTLYPCNVCAKVIVQAGITKVVYYEEADPNDNKYKSSIITLTTCLEEKIKGEKKR